LVTEKIIAVTTEQLARRTKEVYNRFITNQMVLETYLEPLLNEGYIDRTGSDLDHRAYIYYPLVEIPKLFDYSIRGQSNNILHKPKVLVRNPTTYPDKQYLISRIDEIYRYSIAKGFETAIKNQSWKDINPGELVDQYYNNPADYFEYTPEYNDGNSRSPPSRAYYSQLVIKKHVFGIPCESNIFENGQISSESQQSTQDIVEIIEEEEQTKEKLFDDPLIEQSNIFHPLYNYDYHHGPYADLIIEEYLPSLSRTAYKCKEHPDIWRLDPKSLEYDHFIPEHKEVQT